MGERGGQDCLPVLLAGDSSARQTFSSRGLLVGPFDLSTLFSLQKQRLRLLVLRVVIQSLLVSRPLCHLPVTLFRLPPCCAECLPARLARWVTNLVNQGIARTQVSSEIRWLHQLATPTRFTQTERLHLTTAARRSNVATK